MKILFVTSYPLEYNLSANIRNWGLIDGLLANGEAVSTLSPYPTDRKLFNGTIDSECFVKRYWIGGEAKTSSTSASQPTKGGFRIILKTWAYKLFNYFSIYDRRRFLTRKINVREIEDTFDVIISSSDPKSAHLFAREVLKQKPSIARKWVQYWGDPFSNDITTSRLFGNLFVKREEKKLLGWTDRAVYVSPFTAADVKKKYPQFSEKILFLPIPYRLSNDKKSEKYYEKGLVGYFGDYTSHNRNILPFYDAVVEAHIKTNIIGDSDVQLSETELIHIGSRIPSQELKQTTDMTHLFVCVCNLHGTQIPGKVYHYVNTGKPILIVLDGERTADLRKYFESFNRFYLCENTKESILDSLKQVLSEDKSFGIPDALNPQKIAKRFVEF